MATIKAFNGIRPKPELASKVASKPYDVLSSDEARAEAKGNPYSFLNVIKSEITLPEDVDPYSQEVYEQAKVNFDQLMKEGVFLQDEKPNLYIYRQKMDQWEQTGLVALSSIDEYFDDIIKKHEYTRPKKEQDRINNMKATGIHPGPVFLTYQDVEDISAIITNQTEREPVYYFTADDGVEHTFWLLDDEDTIKQLISLFDNQVKYTYIADGHHRAASSAKVGMLKRNENPDYSGDEPFNYFLSVLFPARELNIIDYNRVVKDLGGLSDSVFLSVLDNKFYVKPSEGPFKPPRQHMFGMYLGGKWYSLQAKKGTYDDRDPVASLDVSILQENLLDEILDIKDPRTDDRIDFVGGIRGLQALEKRVDSGEWKAAFSLYPVTIEQLMEIADNDMVMPPKSTWFEPKLRSGLIIHRFEE